MVRLRPSTPRYACRSGLRSPPFASLLNIMEIFRNKKLAPLYSGQCPERAKRVEGLRQQGSNLRPAGYGCCFRFPRRFGLYHHHCFSALGAGRYLRDYSCRHPLVSAPSARLLWFDKLTMIIARLGSGLPIRRRRIWGSLNSPGFHFTVSRGGC